MISRLDRHSVAGLIGVFLGIATGILVADGRVWPLLALPVFAAGLWAAVRALVPSEGRATVWTIIAMSFALHAALAVVLFTGSVALGRRGFTFYDDRTYADVAVLLARYLRGEETPGFGPPLWGSNAYLFGAFVYLESALFFVIGPEPLVAILMNSALALVTAVFVYDMGRRLFDRRAALVALGVVAFYPSLVLWSSLNLKDALTWTVIAVCLWALIRFHARPHWRWLVVPYLAMVPIESVREYIFIGLALLVPIAVAITPRLGLEARLRWTFPPIVVSAAFLLALQSGISAGPQLLALFELERQQMGVGARTRFVETVPFLVREGDVFVIATASPTVALPTPEPQASTGPTATRVPSPSPTIFAPTPSPRIVYVPPNARIVIGTASPLPTVSPSPPRPTAEPSPTVSPGAATPRPTEAPTPAPTVGGEPETVIVRPGDIVVVGSPGTSAAPLGQAQTLVPSQQAVNIRPAEEPVEVLTRRTLSYLPQGIAYALFAPFPWQVETLKDLAVIPEMLLWYAILACAVVTLARSRARWRELFPVAGFAGGLLLLLALVEGNVGTLYRHRAMSLLWVVLLASPVIGAFLDRITRRAR